METMELFRVAQWAGVPAWELLEKPVMFYEGYKAALWIENRVRSELMEKNYGSRK